MTVSTRILRTKAKLVLTEPFFGLLALNLRSYESEECATVWTDGTSIGVNPKFVTSLTDEELEAVLWEVLLSLYVGA